jgi:NAD(P)-dependent dehydrogenase (short-subunit alcohol dehydrogenase family)
MNSKHPALAGQVAVVTGSTQGIGAGIARKFAEQGARIVVHGLASHQRQAEGLVADIQSNGGEALIVVGDLKQEAHCRDVIRQTIERFGRLDILVNNAGIYTRASIEDTSMALWDEILAVNLRAPFILCQEAVIHMKQRLSGCIINIGSLNAYVGLQRLCAYSASKGGLTTLTRNLANYLTKYRIRVNQINPGWVLTEGEHHMRSVEEGQGKDWLEDALTTRPFGRMISPADIANAVLFFATNELVTGAVLDYEQVVVNAMREL